MLSHFQASGNRCRKVNESEIWRVSKILKWKGERILSEPRDFHDFLEKEADHVFHGECPAQTRLSEAQTEKDKREWEVRDADIALDEAVRQLESQRMELYQANQLSVQGQWEKS